MALQFGEWAVKYWNELNPTTGQYWKVEEIATASGTPAGTIQEWLKWASRVNYEYVIANSQAITDSQLMDAWNKEHPPTRTVVTPFGNYQVPVKPPGTPGRSPLDMTVRELLDTIEQLSK